MKPRAVLAVFALLVAASSAGYLVLGRRPLAPATGSAAALPDGPGVASATTPLDPGSLRDVFRFADQAPASPKPFPVLTASDMGSDSAPTATRGPRVVGLVRRSGRLLAVLAVDGQVELAGAGESVAGLSVLSVSEDAVRIRRADGSESTLVY